MADDIVQTIKIEVDGADQAANEIKKVGQATEEVQQTAEKSAGGTQELGKGLDQVSQKSGISSRELRSLSKIAKEFGADSVVVGLSLVRMAAVLGPLGAAVFALGAAFSALKNNMKAAEEQAKAVANTFANLAEKSAQMKLKDEAAFWGMSEAAMKEWNNEAGRVIDQYKNIEAGRQKAISADVSSDARQKGLIELLRQAGVQIGDLDADTDKLGESANKALMVFAKLGEKMSPIGKAELAKDIKALGFTDEQVKSIEKGAAALKKAQEEAAKFKASPAGQALKEFDAAVVRSQDTVAGWGQTLKQKFAEAVLGIKMIATGQVSLSAVFARAGEMIVQSLGSIGSAIASAVSAWVTTAVPGAWQWIVATAASVWEQVKTLAGQARDAVVAFVTTAPAAAWQWIVATAASVWGQVQTLAGQAKNAVVQFIATAPGQAWQWIVDTFNSVVELVISKAGEAKDFITNWVTTAVPGAWEWLKSTFFSAVDGIIAKANEAKSFIGTWVTTPVAGAWEWLKTTFWAAVDAMLAKFNAMKAAMSGGGGAPAPAASRGGAFAGGGLLGGRGSGTSDSNLAWVSRGEFITPARAVRQPGVLAFLEALRLSGGNLRDVLDGMGRFALGGLVPPRLSIPAFAGGGAINNVTIQFPGLPEITGLRASSGVVDELRKAAALAQVRSGGRKPSRYS